MDKEAEEAAGELERTTVKAPCGAKWLVNFLALKFLFKRTTLILNLFR